MNRGRSWLVWGAGVLTALIIGAIVTAGRSQGEPEGLPSLSAHSSRPDGALALFLWTSKLGRDAEYLEYRPFRLTTRDALLVSLEPLDEYDADQLHDLRSWMEAGGTLLLADDQTSTVHQDLHLGVRSAQEYASARLAQPLDLQPGVAKVSATSTSVLDPGTAAPVLVADLKTQRPVLVSTTVGRGRAWVLSMPGVLANSALSRDDNSELYQNVVASARPGRVLFDEYHHGRPAVPSLRALIYSSPWGWALLYTSVLLLVYVALRGKRLGRPLRPQLAQSRNAGEYVRSLASLLQGADKREFLTGHYLASLTRTLREASGMPPDSSLGAMQARVEERTGVRPSAIVEAIQELEQGVPPPKRLARLVRDAELERRRIARR